MANNKNQCNFTGRLGADPELKEAGSTQVCNINIAVGGSKKVGDNWQDTVEWVPLVFWGNNAKNLCSHMRKGSLIGVTGRFMTRSWDDKDGVKQFRSEINVQDLEFLGGKTDGGNAASTPAPQRSQQGAPPTAQEFDDDIPFTPIQSYP